MEKQIYIYAAGGLVTNTDEKLLVIFRRGFWDLPKGKIFLGETPEQAALREVQEETGLQNLTLGPFLAHTWHTYKENGTNIRKFTWWYRMQTDCTDTVPQTEEDIEEIRWVEPITWLASDAVMYDSIREIVEKSQRL